MRVLFLGLVMGALSFGAESAGLSVPVVLFTRYQVDPPAGMESSIRDELAKIISPAGVRFEWRPLPTAQLFTGAAELAVITFKGHCDLSSINPLQTRAAVLGVTHLSEGAILPFSDINCDEVRKFLQRDLLMERPDRRRALYARAIARVLAHELYHILANTAKHAGCGLGKPIYTVTDLLADDFAFERRDVIALQKGKVKVELKNSPHSGRSTALEAADDEVGH